MEVLHSYLQEEKNNNEKRILELNQKINRNIYEIQKIEKDVVECAKNIDTTYEIFSPNAFNQNYNVVEIEKLNIKKVQLEMEIEELTITKKKLIERQKIIDLAFDEYEEVKQQNTILAKEYKNSVKKEKKKLEELYNEELTELLECQIEQNNHFVSSEILRQFELIENKLSLCGNIVDMDINRAKLQLIKISEEISYFKKKINSKMFHVKHYDHTGYYDLNMEIKEFIGQYKKSLNAKIDYKYHGRSINDVKENIIHLIRIIKEAIDNATLHSDCSTINISIDVDDYDFESENNDQNITDVFFENIEIIDTENNDVITKKLSDNDWSVSQLKDEFENNKINNSIDKINIKDIETQKSNSVNKEDIHQINFVIEDQPKKYTVIVKISDNGNGFDLQNSQILKINGRFGIYLMKYRARQMNGTLNIVSEKGLGTTVTIMYYV